MKWSADNPPWIKALADVRRMGKLEAEPSRWLAIAKALEKAGVEFIAENGGGAGARLKKRGT
jgi:hypothetical protein